MASIAFSVPDSVSIIYLSYKEMMAFRAVDLLRLVAFLYPRLTTPFHLFIFVLMILFS